MKKYIPANIETKWQQKWEDEGVYKTAEFSEKPKKYILDMFPYPSGDGLHVGHCKIYNASDILSRYFRLKGFNVLHPMGWDAFGLNAENYAIKNKMHPSVIIQKSISNIKRQMQMVGFSYDWDREINTTDPEYYKWTQWIFLKLFEKGLAYESELPINWCPQDKTGLANEEVIAGKCERCGTQVERKVIRQWVLKITEYADRLLEDLQGLDWPQSIIDMQVNWIGKSGGSKVKFDIENKDYDVEVFTTRTDTIYGVTALMIAPEHPKVEDLTLEENKDSVQKYIEHIQGKSDLERTELNKEKTGVFTGSYAINPLSGEKLPIWVADYVLGFYGTGAVMFVPAHDERDYGFAKKFDLPIKEVIKTDSKELPTTEYGKLVNSGEFDGLSSNEAKLTITEWLRGRDKGDFQTQYKLRDWLFSRQRYWGEPIPIIHCKSCGLVPVPEKDLPVKLPDVENYEPTGTGESPLAAIEEWVNINCPKCGGLAKRETNTMPQWAGSCWYYLRFINPRNNEELVNPEKERYWMPVDWYIGGAEHAVLHLLYARFWHKVLFDEGIVSTKEPFQKLSSVGLVQAADGRKMSKSLGNVITPDDIVNEYGVDSLRLYEAFMGPFENIIAWDPTSINGVYKFLTRVWEVIQKDNIKDNIDEADGQVEVYLNRAIKRVGEEIEEIRLNTPIASMMEFINVAFHKNLTRDQKKRFLIILAPFAPHITEELWEILGEKFSVHQQSWPEVDEKYLEEDEVTIAVQINGKVRDTMKISRSQIEDRESLELQVLKSERVQKFLEGKEVKKTIYIPGKIFSIVISDEG